MYTYQYPVHVPHFAHNHNDLYLRIYLPASNFAIITIRKTTMPITTISETNQTAELAESDPID